MENKTTENKPTVWVLNESGHDYSQAEEFGTLRFLTKGKVDSFASNKYYRIYAEALKDMQDGDYVLLTGLASMNLILGWIIGHKQLRLRILLYKNRKYVVRELMPNLI